MSFHDLIGELHMKLVILILASPVASVLAFVAIGFFAAVAFNHYFGRKD